MDRRTVLLIGGAGATALACGFCRRHGRRVSLDATDADSRGGCGKSSEVPAKARKGDSLQRRPKKEQKQQSVSGRASADIKSLPKEERAGALTTARAENAAGELREKGRCETCALVLQNCICGGLASLRQELGHAGDVGVRFALWMHVTERVRASNTGKLMNQVLPDCEVFVHGVPADAERFRARIASCNAYVLFPSEDAVPLSAVVGDLKQGTEAASGSPCSAPLIVLVDGTWDQARRMHKALKDLPHVALETQDGAGSSGFTWRQQSEEGRVTTAEAAAFVLDGLTSISEAAATGAKCLRQAVSLLDRSLESQTHYSKLEPPRASRILEPELVVKPKRGCAVEDGEAKPVCKHYLRGTCRYGDDCTFSHTGKPGMTT